MPQTGQYAIVTGGSSGIGRAVVARLQEGATGVAILDINDPGPVSGAEFLRDHLALEAISGSRMDVNGLVE
jgi:NAD(P)-dependent dehydrogenase (short-subunit alcohol dehydrogenase family)